MTTRGACTRTVSPEVLLQTELRLHVWYCISCSYNLMNVILLKNPIWFLLRPFPSFPFYNFYFSPLKKIVFIFFFDLWMLKDVHSFKAVHIPVCPFHFVLFTLVLFKLLLRESLSALCCIPTFPAPSQLFRNSFSPWRITSFWLKTFDSLGNCLWWYPAPAKDRGMTISHLSQPTIPLCCMMG